MFSVVEIKGHQYLVSPGDLIDVELMEQPEGARVDFAEVLFVGGENPQVGKPMMHGRKGTREHYIPPFRLSYEYFKDKDLGYILDFYHKDEQ